MQIPKQVSRPANPNEPSFLNLPAEIRNHVYELLFTRDGPVLLYNAQAYHAFPPEYADEYEKEIIHGQLFFHDFQKVTPALLVCRQVYAEAVGYLYSNNTFMFSRPLYRHDTDNGDFLDNDDSYHLVTNYVAEWLQDLGSQLELLTKVQIDAGALCPDQCIKRSGCIPILQLVRLLWKHPYLKNVVEFTQREPTKLEQAEVGDIHHFREAYEMKRAEHLQSILIAISAQDVLDLKRYAGTNLLVNKVTLSSYLGKGRVTGPNLSWTFEASEHHAVRWAEADQSSLSLESLPCRLVNKILGLVMFPTHQIVLDLDLRTIRGFNPVFFHLSRTLRLVATHPPIPHDTSIVVRKSISTTNTDLKNFAAALMPYKSNGLGGRHPTYWFPFGYILAYRSRTSIVLYFDIATTTSLKEFRVNIKDFVPVLSHRYFPFEAKFRFVLKCPWRESIHYEEAAVSAAELLPSLFLLLADFMQQWRSYMSKIDDSELPDIWLNGHGALLFASYPASSHSPGHRAEYAHGHLTPNEIRNRGYRRALTFDPVWNLKSRKGMLSRYCTKIIDICYGDRMYKRT